MTSVEYLGRSHIISRLMVVSLGGRRVPALKEYVEQHAKRSSVLLPQASRKRSYRNKGWKLYVNAKVEAEL